MKLAIASWITLCLLALGALYVCFQPVSPEERVTLQQIMNDAQSMSIAY